MKDDDDFDVNGVCDLIYAIVRFANLSKIEEVVVKADQVEEGGPEQDIW